MKILQIMPATGWTAKYKQDDESISESPLVCFALVEEEDGNTTVVAMDSDSNGLILSCGDTANFCGLGFRGLGFKEQSLEGR